jgi:carboxylesterase
LILHSKDDRVSAASSADYLYENLGCEQKRLVYLQDSGHVIALGRERELVEKLVGHFLTTGAVR